MTRSLFAGLATLSLLATPAAAKDAIKPVYHTVGEAVRNGAMYKFTKYIKKIQPERGVEVPPGGLSVKLLKVNKNGTKLYAARAHAGSSVTVTLKKQDDGYHVKSLGRVHLASEDFE